MDAKEIIAKLTDDGWQQVRQKGSHRQFRHPTKPGLVSVPDHGSKDLKLGTIKSIETQSEVRLR